MHIHKSPSRKHLPDENTGSQEATLLSRREQGNMANFSIHTLPTHRQCLHLHLRASPFEGTSQVWREFSAGMNSYLYRGTIPL